MVRKLTGLCAAAAAFTLVAEKPAAAQQILYDAQNLDADGLPPISYVTGTPFVLSGTGALAENGAAQVFSLAEEARISTVNFQAGNNFSVAYDMPPGELWARIAIWVGPDATFQWVEDPMASGGNIEGRQYVRNLQLESITKWGTNDRGGNAWQTSWSVVGPDLVVSAGTHMMMIIGSVVTAVQQSAVGDSTLIYAYDSDFYPANELWELQHIENRNNYTDKPLLVTLSGMPLTNEIDVRDPELGIAQGPNQTLEVRVSYNAPDVQLQETTNLESGPWVPVYPPFTEEPDPAFAENGRKRTYTVPTGPTPPTGAISPMDAVPGVPVQRFFRALNLD